MVGGATATPWRGDHFDIDTILGQPVAKIGIDEGLRRGFLCEADYRLLADNIDWEFVRKQSRNEYSIKELNTRLLIPTRDEEAARVIADTFKKESRRSLIVFARVSSMREPSRPCSSSMVSGRPTSPGRWTLVIGRKTMAGLRRGTINAVTTVDIFNEGVDVPDVDMLAFMRVTHSRRIFVQQLGRGLRLAPNKDKVVVLDFVSDLRRISEVIDLQKSISGDVERLDLVERIVQFSDHGAGHFMFEWLLDQADLFNREGDAKLELPEFNFPLPPSPGAVQ